MLVQKFNPINILPFDAFICQYLTQYITTFQLSVFKQYIYVTQDLRLIILIKKPTCFVDTKPGVHKLSLNQYRFILFLGSNLDQFMSPSLTKQGRDSNFGSGRVQRQQNINKYTSIGVNRIAVELKCAWSARQCGKLKTSEVPRVNEMRCGMGYKIMK